MEEKTRLSEWPEIYTDLAKSQHISKEIAKIIENEIKKSNPTDGIMDTKEILYLVENQFKQELAQSLGTVKVSNGKEKSVSWWYFKCS